MGFSNFQFSIFNFPFSIQDMNRLLTFILALICCLGIQAQNQKFLDGLRANEPGKGTVTVTQSPAIDVLVNGNPQSANNNSVAPTPAAPVTHHPLREYHYRHYALYLCRDAEPHPVYCFLVE